MRNTWVHIEISDFWFMHNLRSPEKHMWGLHLRRNASRRLKSVCSLWTVGEWIELLEASESRETLATDQPSISSVKILLERSLSSPSSGLFCICPEFMRRAHTLTGFNTDTQKWILPNWPPDSRRTRAY